MLLVIDVFYKIVFINIDLMEKMYKSKGNISYNCFVYLY